MKLVLIYSGFEPPTAFHEAEMGNIDICPAFYDWLARDLKRQRAWEAYLFSNNLAPSTPQPLGLKTLNGQQFFVTMMGGAKDIDGRYVRAIKRLSKAGLITAALTNNTLIAKDEDLLRTSAKRQMALKTILYPFIESSRIHLRKPNPVIYDVAIKALGVKPEEIVFLDDIGINLQQAKSRGIRTIKVNLGRTHEALRELEKVVGFALLDSDTYFKANL